MEVAQQLFPSSQASPRTLKPLDLKNLKPHNKPCLKIRLLKVQSPRQESLNNLPTISLPRDKKSYKSQHLQTVKSHKSLSPKSPMSSKSFKPSNLVPNNIFSNLNSFEQEEILEYNEVYYSGNIKYKVSPDPDLNNFGFDFENGSYKLVQGDHLAYRYEIRNYIGKGTYGVVCECYDHKAKELVAIKILKNKKVYHQQGGIEVSLLKAISDNDPEDHNDLVKLKYYFYFRNHICMVFPLLGASLFDLFRKCSFVGLTMAQVKNFTVSILKSLNVLKTISIIHCDLKPENLLFTNSSFKQIKLIDFGSSCFTYERVHSYIQSRFYRAPEIVLGISYTEAIDMWSLGCIVVEMCSGKVLFPCENESDLIKMIVETIGNPPIELIKRAKKKAKCFDETGSLRKPKLKCGEMVVPFGKPIEVKDTLMADFLRRCLEWEPEERLTPSQALEHPWITNKIRGKSLSHAKLKKRHLTHV